LIADCSDVRASGLNLWMWTVEYFQEQLCVTTFFWNEHSSFATLKQGH
jgi:hypothetical protein